MISEEERETVRLSCRTELVERRWDREDGHAYTQAGFLRCYGEDEGELRWLQAPAKRIGEPFMEAFFLWAEARGQELRWDVADGKAYFKADFLRAYASDGETRWSASPLVALGKSFADSCCLGEELAEAEAVRIETGSREAGE